MQIYEYFKNEIINGTYKANTKLPSKRNLAKEYKVSLNTVDNAYSKLLEEGFIYSKERQGFFVSDVGELYVLDNKPIHITKEEENIEFYARSSSWNRRDHQCRLYKIDCSAGCSF